MKLTHVFTVAALGAVVLTGCISGPTGGAHYGFYDGAYGTYHGGFWGTDGHFYYFTDASRVKVARDDNGHFRPQMVRGFYQVEARPRIRKLERQARAEDQQANVQQAAQ